MIARVKYQKGDAVKYVGHLDTMRTFIRCIKRTMIPVEYSKGFNPRVQISFALPLGVGVTSEEEYFDLKISEKMNENMFIGELNSVLPSGFRAIEVKYVEDDKKSLMSLVEEAIYEIKIGCDFDFSQISELLSETELNIEKESKSKKKKEEINLKKFILDVGIDESKKIITIHSTAGSLNNLNPSLLITAIENKLGKIDDYNIHRKNLMLRQ